MRRLAIAASLLLILLLTTWPLHRYIGHSHWDRVEWLPFSRGLVTVDFAANVLLFIPFGLAIGWPGDPRRVRYAVMAGAIISLGAETYQVYCHAFPTTTDVLANTFGAWLGAASGRLRRHAKPVASVPDAAHETSAT